MKALPIVIVLLCTWRLGAAPVAIPSERIAYGDQRVHATRLLARFVTATNPAAQQSILAACGEKIVRRYATIPGLVVLTPEPTPAPAGSATSTPILKPRLKERIRTLLATGAFRYVHPDYELHTLLAPDDAGFNDGTLWGLKNTGLNGGTIGADLNAESAWNLTTGSTAVIVAVIDTGIRYTHQELAAQLWQNPGEIAGNGLDDDNDGFVDNVHGINAITDSGDPMDDNDHGTHVAGTIGAAANDGHPHVGVAWNVRLMACKFLDAYGSGNTSDAIECIQFAVTNGARVLNNSWGGGPFQPALFDAITMARNQGALFVAAAGNGGADGIGDNNDVTPAYPASYAVDNIISVAAVDRAEQLAGFSNFGQNAVHLGAPGVAIFSCTSGGDDQYGTFDGTSMATPHVSGVAALVLAQSPGLTYGELRTRILQGAVPIPALAGVTQTGGRLNALNALVATGDNQLEAAVYSAEGTTLSAGSTVSVYVKVTDLTNVNNATVTGASPALPALTFLNDGVAPDETSGDGIYSAQLLVPPAETAFELTVIAAAPGKDSVTNVVTFTILQTPPNDSFASAILIPPGGGSVQGTNINATTQPLEPSACGSGAGKTVWWQWTAPANAITTITTAGSDFDTVLAVYTGNAINALTSVGCNDDVPGGVYSSEVIFQAVAGTTYRIAVDGFAGNEGIIALSLTETPPVTNDNFASRAPLSGVNRLLRSSNFGATVEGGEPYHCGNWGGASVWWTWTAPSNVDVTISTAGSTYDTVLAIYTGSSYNTLLDVACNDDRVSGAVPSSEVSFSAVAGETYQIAVDGSGDGLNAAEGNITLNLVTTPANDNFARRLPLVGAFAQTNGCNLRATYEPGEPYHTPAGGEQSVWWTWTAPADGNVAVSTWGSSFDTTLAVYTGAAVNALNLVASNDDESYPIRRTSRISFAATAATTYAIAVDGFFHRDLWGSPLGTDNGLITLTLSLDGKSRLDDFKLRPDGGYEFVLRGDAGRKYQIESAVAPTGPWTVIGEILLNGPSSIFIDPLPPAGPGRYYRAVVSSLTQ